MRGTIAVSVVAVLSAFAFAQDQHDKKGHAKNGALERFAQLDGEWTGKGVHDGKETDARIVYKVTSGGSAVVETIDPGGPHEMVSVIHADGNALALTHYCMLGNQPHMRAVPKPGDNKVAFEFVKATNLKSAKDACMHSATFTFADRDTLQTEWTLYQDGKEAGRAVFSLKRKKKAISPPTSEERPRSGFSLNARRKSTNAISNWEERLTLQCQSSPGSRKSSALRRRTRKT
jgi:hypothetical protein